MLGSELRRLVTVVFLDAQREEESPALRWLYSVCDNFEQFYARLQLLLTPTERTVELPPCSVEYPTEEECAHEVGSVVCMLV